MGVGAVVDFVDGVEVFLVLVLEEVGDEVCDFAGFGLENLAFAVDGVFLEVVGDGLCGAEILHCLGDGVAHLLAEAEVVVDGCFGREDYGGVCRERNFLLAELACLEAFHLDEGAENDFHAVFLGKFVVGRLVG